VPEAVGVVGATSLVGRRLLPRLVQAGIPVCAFTRGALPADSPGIRWCSLGGAPMPDGTTVTRWVVLAPIWSIDDALPWLAALGARRVVALSSTSRFTKAGSSQPRERDTAEALVRGEQRLAQWADDRGVQWLVLRPTLIYGLDADGNISTIARFIRRFGFFPVLGAAGGRRQPIHCDDVADACVRALQASVSGRAYEVSGAEILSYRAMVARVFEAMGRRPRVLRVPLPVFRAAIAVARIAPRLRGWSPAMAERMNVDMVFAHDDAARDLGFAPRGFVLDADDLPESAAVTARRTALHR
jgi:nucleoside-diphosphate-sugar epimerase